jgi:pyroglutamyl-peptidase
MKKLLIYGFEPYKNITTNISVEIIKRLYAKNKLVLPVKFDNSLILNKIRKIKPDIIVGLGSSRKARFLRIERTAKNIIKLKNSKKEGFIKKNGPEKYFVNLKLKKINGTRISYYAGTYVCNYIMYSIMDFIKINKLDIKFAYIHIPRSMEVNKALFLVKRLLKNHRNQITLDYRPEFGSP